MVDLFQSRPKAQEFDYNTLTSPEGREGFLCISQSTWELAYSLVTYYGYWRSRYYKTDDVTGDQLELTDEEWTTVTDIVDLAVEELSMTSCDEFIAAFNNIAAQIGLLNISVQGAASVSGCCSPYGTPVPSPAPDEGDPEIDDPPDGFDTWEDYFTYKCKAANKIADDWIGTLENLTTLSGILATIGGLALAAFLNTTLLSGVLVGLMVLGFSAGAAAAIIIGALIALVVGGIGLLAYFAAVATEMETNKEDLVCQLFAAQSVEAAKGIVLTFTTDIAADLTYDPGDDDTLFQSTLATITDALFNESVVNTLFVLNTDVAEYVGDIDCDTCGQPALTDWILLPSGAFAGVTTATGFVGSGTILQDGTQFTLSSVEKTNEPGTHAIAMIVSGFLAAQGTDNLFQTDPTGTDGGTITRQSNGSGINVLHGRTAVACAHGVTQPSTANAPATDNNFQFVYYQANNSFTLDFTIDAPPSAC